MITKNKCLGVLCCTPLLLLACSKNADQPGNASDVDSGAKGNNRGSASDDTRPPRPDAGSRDKSDNGPPEEDASQAGASGADADNETLPAVYGTFRVQLIPPDEATPDGYVSVLGLVYDGAPPPPKAWKAIDEAGDCQLYERAYPFCDPDCKSGEKCVAGDQCQRVPSPLDVGIVTLEGIADESIAMTALAPSNTYQLPADAMPNYPPFDAKTQVVLSAEGGAAGAFAIQAQGIDPLEREASAVSFDPDADAVIDWTPGADPSATVELVFDISHHGGQNGELICEASDTGEFTVPRKLVAGLIELGVAGFPEVRITRKSVGVASDVKGELRLQLESSRVVYLDIPGLSSCSEPGAQAECKDDEQCGQDLRCAAQ